MMLPMLAILLSAGQQDGPVTDASACARLTRDADETRPQLPAMVDPVTRLDAIETDCAVRTYTMVKTIVLPMNGAREGWQGRMQAALNEAVCGSSLRDIERLGWRFIQKTRFPGGEEVTMQVSCDGD